jgi:hypothetical protein
MPAKKKTTKKKSKKKVVKASKKRNMRSTKLATKTKPATKNKAAKRKKSIPRRGTVQLGSQSVDTVSLQPKARVARAGAGGGDFQGISVVEDVDSESADELLEEGQAFESGVVSGVENAPDPDESEVVTHEVLQDDVPEEYEDKDR